MINIQKAKIQYLEQIQKLNLAFFEKEHQDYDTKLNLKRTFSKKGTKYFIQSIENKDATTIVALDGERIIGYVVFWIIYKNFARKFKKYAELENMFILPEYRNQKIGIKLVEEGISWAKTKGVQNVKVSAYTDNTQGLAFYKKLGFENYSTTLELTL